MNTAATTTAGPALEYWQDDPSHPAARALAAIARRTVTAYHGDWEIDRRHIAEIGAAVPFVWYARSYGTHIYSRASVRAGVGSGWRGYAACTVSIGRDHDGRDGSGWRYWDGAKLRRCSTESAAELVGTWEREAPPETPEGQRARYLRGGW